MSSEKIYGSNWSINDISRYVDGDMTTDEVRLFETDLSNDAFLKDAVDGYAGHARIYVDHHLQRLNKAFKPKSRRLAIPMWVTAAAASIALLAGAWFLFGDQIRTTGSNVFAENDSIISTSNKKVERESAEIVLTENEAQDDFSAADSVADVVALNESSEASPAQVAPRAQTRIRSARRRAATNRIGGIVSGAVLDEAGQPLIGANVYFPSNEAAITTDFNGKFAVELKSYDSIAIVNYVGFESGIFSIDGGTNNQFKLSLSETELAEVVVTETPARESTWDMGTMDLEQTENKEKSSILKEESDVELDATPAEPSKGYRKYDRYIRRNLQYPAAARSPSVEGIVIVSFKVLPNGDIFDLRVVQSVGSGCDEEAIRLIKEGPSWAGDGQVGVRQGRYSVEFKLK